MCNQQTRVISAGLLLNEEAAADVLVENYPMWDLVSNPMPSCAKSAVVAAARLPASKTLDVLL